MSKIEKSSAGLVNASFEALEQLKSGVITAQQARAFSSVCNTIISVTRLELEYQRFVSDVRQNDTKDGLPPIRMGQIGVVD